MTKNCPTLRFAQDGAPAVVAMRANRTIRLLLLSPQCYQSMLVVMASDPCCFTILL